jgi:hypothetical protein
MPIPAARANSRCERLILLDGLPDVAGEWGLWLIGWHVRRRSRGRVIPLSRQPLLPLADWLLAPCPRAGRTHAPLLLKPQSSWDRLHRLRIATPSSRRLLCSGYRVLRPLYADGCALPALSRPFDLSNFCGIETRWEVLAPNASCSALATTRRWRRIVARLICRFERSAANGPFCDNLRG